MLYKSQHETLRRSIRLVIADEQTNMLELIKKIINHHIQYFEQLESMKIYVENIYKAKRLFEIDQLRFPSASEDVNFDIIIEQQELLKSLQMDSHMFRGESESLMAECGKFTPVKLDAEEFEGSQHEEIKFPTEYATAQKDCNSPEQRSLLIIDSEASIEHLQVSLQNCNIQSSELKLLKVIGRGSSCEV